jgi:precorrin-6B methylase 2
MKKRQARWLFTSLFILWSMQPGLAFGQSSSMSPLSEPAQSKQMITVPAFESRTPDVPYVPTPEEVVSTMLEVAGVNKDDIVYDLGCGDGRIVITAAEKKGARGVGIDINPQRIRESNKNAQRANVADRVQFIQQDLFTTDLSEATVVTLYLLSTVNLKLRPKLFRELKPGTRIVSHAFDMKDWQVDQFERVSHSKIYYWVMPANVTGVWEWTAPAKTGEELYVLKLDQKFQQVSGSLTIGTTEAPIENAQLAGDNLRFTVDHKVNGQMRSMQYEGRVKGDSIEGSIKPENGTTTSNMNWKAQRNPSTVTAIDGS